ncbi:cationic amino acid transporter 4 isoform X1 [Equus caballus]|uniref:cationic amino acid transporter 4 isoform X1 n=1 Tax=Equus caballus TaxID=9796 RepID=UPI0038B3C0C8
MAQGLPSTTSLEHFSQKLNRLKTLEEPTTEKSLQPHLTTLELTLLGVGGMVGSGFYVLMGTVAKEVAGPAVLISFGVAAVASLLAALCYAEIVVPMPHKGSAYLFTYASMGELWAFLMGWNMLLKHLIGGAAVARIFSSYLDAIFSRPIRSFAEAHVGIWQVPFLAQYPDFLAAGIILLASASASCRARVYSWLNTSFSAISLIVMLFIIILGSVLAHPHNWSTEVGGFAPFGFSGIMAGTATCFYAFVGFDIIAASSRETQNPKRAVPMASAISLGLVAVAYILVSAVLTLMVPWHSLDPDWALAEAFYKRGYSWVGFVVVVESISAMNSVLISNLFFLPRVVRIMAADGLFFQVFAHVHPQTQVPIVGMLVFGVLMAFLALLLDLETLVQFLCISALLTYIFVAISVIMLRFQKAPPSSSLDPGSREGTEQTSAEPGQLRPALRPYLRFLGGYRPGAAVAWALGVLVGSAITLDCVLVFGDSALHLPPWGYTLLLLLSSITFLLSLLVLGAHQQQRRQDTFQVPMAPLTPALSILLNIFLILHQSYLAWLGFFICLLIGLCHPCRTRGVFWLRHQAQQGEPAGAAGIDSHTRQPGGDGASPAAHQPGTGPGAQPQRAARQSMRTTGGLPSLPYLLRRSEVLAAPLSGAAQLGRPAHARGSSGPQDLSPGAELRVLELAVASAGVVDSAQCRPVYDQLQLPGQVE